MITIKRVLKSLKKLGYHAYGDNNSISVDTIKGIQFVQLPDISHENKFWITKPEKGIFDKLYEVENPEYEVMLAAFGKYLEAPTKKKTRITNLNEPVEFDFEVLAEEFFNKWRASIIFIPIEHHLQSNKYEVFISDEQMCSMTLETKVLYSKGTSGKYYPQWHYYFQLHHDKFLSGWQELTMIYDTCEDGDTVDAESLRDAEIYYGTACWIANTLRDYGILKLARLGDYDG